MEDHEFFRLPCCCNPDHTIRDGGRFINIIVLNKKAHSKFLSAHDFWLDGKRRQPRAAAFICDRCLEAHREPLYAYCRDNDDQEPYRVPVCELEDWTMENSMKLSRGVANEDGD